MLNVKTESLPRLDRTIPRCKVINLGSGSAPKFVTVELPYSEQPRVLARWSGSPSIAINDYVRVQRRGVDGQYDIVGTDAGTVAHANVHPKPGKCNVGETEYASYSDMMAALSGAGEQGLIGEGAFNSAGEQLPDGDHLQGRGIGVSAITKVSGTYALDIRGACTIQDIEYVISGGNVCVAKTAGGQANLTNVRATVTPDTGDDVGFLCSSGTLIMRNCEVGYSGSPEYSIEADGAGAFIVVLGGYFSGSVRAKNGGTVWLIGSQIQGGTVEQTGGTVEGLYFTGTDLFFIGDLISSGGADIKLLGSGKLLLDVDSDSYIEALVDDIIKMFVAGSESGRFNTSGLALPQGKEISLQGAAGGPQSSTARNLIEKIGHILDGGHPANPYPSTRDDDDAEFNNSEQSENNTIGTHAGGDSWEWSPGVPSNVSINGTIDSHLYVSKAAGDSGTDRALLLDISSIGEDDARKFELFVTSLPKTNKTGNVFSIKLTDTTSGKYIRLKMDDDSSNGMQIVATYDTGGGETTSATIAIGHPIGPAAIALRRYTFGSDAYGRFYFGLEGSPAAEHLHQGNDYFAIINMGAKADYIPDDFRLEWSNVSFFTTVIDSVRIT